MRKSIFTLLLVIASQLAIAQSGCNANAHFNDFDFWVGEWEVTDNSTGNLAGSNSITKELNNCLVMENWAGASGSVAKSINYFNPLDNSWRQLWVAPGYVIDISGGLENEAMVLVGTIAYFNDTVYEFRGSWRPASDGSVRHFFEQFDPENESWAPWFDGRYAPTKR